ncbi:MAG: DUF4404 family protein [Planctomycetes bacterium]|nr:DUF4404 family protein [Planctomycetota bacterium]
MIDNTLKRIEEKLADANLTDEKRSELLALLTDLKGELDVLAQKDEPRAQSVANLAEVTSLEAMRDESDDKLLDLSLQSLSASVEKFEVEQPHLAKVINSICMLLSNSGI